MLLHVVFAGLRIVLLANLNYFLISFPNRGNLPVLGDKLIYCSKSKYEFRTLYVFIFIRPCEVSL